MLKELHEKMLISDTPVTAVIRKTDHFKVIAIGLNQGVVLKKHKAPGTTKLMVIKGNINYSAGQNSIDLGEYDEYDIPLEEIHEVNAHEPSILLLMVG